MTGITERLKVAVADRYLIERELGQGGMATVYLAHDVKHDRKVALKVLRPELAAVIGAERFLQEIKVTANLQHSHILPLYDSGAAEGFLYYVMPYVEGETLRTRIDREKQLAVDEAVAIARAVAAALEHAHKQGVVHRDIKPENILLRDNDPLIADFGIALAVSHAAGNRLTETGLSIGTPHYMSPEQAMGDRELDARSDVYSLGAVVYEMLTGDPPYSGSTAQAIVARVITEEPRPITAQRRTVPPHVADAVHKALHKLPADRFHSAASFAEALVTPGYVTPTHVRTGVHTAAAPVSVWKRALWPGIAAILLAAAILGWLRPRTPAPVARYGLALPPGQEVILGANPTFALAPDGSFIVYDGFVEQGAQLWIKPRDRYEATPVSGTGSPALGPATAPAVSPDGAWIMFTVGGQLRKVPRVGGSAVTIADSVSMTTRGVAWLDDGTIVYRDTQNRLRRASDAGGSAAVVWTPPAEGDVRPILPTPLPKARGVLFTACYGASCQPLDLWILDLRSGESRLLVSGVAQGWYAGTGHLVYVRPDGGVFAAPFDLGSLDLTGQAVPIVEGVRVAGGRTPSFALSRSGTVLMAIGPSAGGIGPRYEAVWVERDGKVTPIDSTWTFHTTGNSGWALSPDGRRLATKLTSELGDDIWIKELDGGPLSRLTVDPAGEFRPRWTPDGRTVSYMSTRGENADVFIRRADGTLPPELLVDLDEPIFEVLWSRDGRWLVLRTGLGGNRDIWAQRLGVDSAPARLLATDFDERAVSLSPDARWIAYQSDETGRNEVYVRPFPDITAGKWTISLDGGSRPLWSHSGRELFYADGMDARMMAAQIRAGPGGIEVTERRPLFSLANYLLSANYTPFDVSADDRRFLMLREVGAANETQNALIVIENWFGELRERVRR
jgi:serine/threonine-protein kinase